MPEIAEREGEEASVMPYHLPACLWEGGRGRALVRMGSCRGIKVEGRWVALRCDCYILLFLSWLWTEVNRALCCSLGGMRGPDPDEMAFFHPS